MVRKPNQKSNEEDEQLVGEVINNEANDMIGGYTGNSNERTSKSANAARSLTRKNQQQLGGGFLQEDGFLQSLATRQPGVL